MLSTLVHWHATPTQVVIAGDKAAAGASDLEQALARHYMPWAVTVRLATPDAATSLATQAPWLAAMTARDGRATAYVCRDFTCSAPVTEAVALSAQLDDAAAPRRIIQA